MRSSHNDLIEVLKLIEPTTVIPTLEKGIEIEKLELAANPNCEVIKTSIKNSRILLSFLYNCDLRS
jgi:hypothetical protein